VKPDECWFPGTLKITNLVGVGKKTEQRLNEMNVRTIGDISTLSMDVLSGIRESKREWLKLASHGMDDSPLRNMKVQGRSDG